MLEGKKILIGITGGIAAYKICSLVRNFIKQGAQVKVVMTENAKEFVTETTLSTLSKNQVYTDTFSSGEYSIKHVSLVDEADVFVLAPATANTLGKVANGICDNLLSSLLCACTKPVVFAPAMNTNMWNNSLVQKNIKTLQNQGWSIVEPGFGELACGYNGDGRMAEIEQIEAKVVEILGQKQVLAKKKIVITSGGTKEELDPVRYIGNYSSGKMGLALADAAYQMGADVELVTTILAERPYKVTVVKSANQMLDEASRAFDGADCLIMAAAVADYRPVVRSEQKIKKDSESLTLELIKNPDIVSTIASGKKSGQIVVGFAAESEDLIENAKKKITAKNLDYIVANDISDSSIGFGSDENEVFVIDKNLDIQKIEKDSKKNIAKKILKAVFDAN
ncbi:MAG: bifunctional phosphopantothenoylcysteine decarboxylase/phosphopantothenate--cysteine ligase CoaBC [Candidatus Gastranaerophilales bacterium]|nr:bifunctional phosphopantothenoylcysteine decarboxylase/phosphopantothenate--cysteine ligase CoaBC [Candidatus Gastranaerophilales bacterium]